MPKIQVIRDNTGGLCCTTGLCQPPIICSHQTSCSFMSLVMSSSVDMPETITSSLLDPWCSGTFHTHGLWWPFVDWCSGEQRFPYFYFGLCSLNWPFCPLWFQHFPFWFSVSLPLISSHLVEAKSFTYSWCLHIVWEHQKHISTDVQVIDNVLAFS